MFTRMIVSKVKKELERVNFDCDTDIILMKVSDNNCILKIFKDNKSYVVEFYENDSNKEKTIVLSLMEKYGIKSVKCYVNDPKIFVYEDISELDNYRMAGKDDLNNEEVVKGLARWYKKLHQNKDDGCRGFCDLFTLNNIREIMVNLNLNHNKAMCYIEKNFNNIKLKLDRLNKCFVYGGFFLERVVICDDCKDVFLNDFSNISLGYSYLDIKNVLNNLNDRSKEIFLKEYGFISEDEIAVDKVVSTIIELYNFINNSSSSVPSKDVIDSINDGRLFESARSLVEWY